MTVSSITERDASTINRTLLAGIRRFINTIWTIAELWTKAIFFVVPKHLIYRHKVPYMKHFSERVWASFVRGRGKVDTNRQIETHIANGCPDCVAMVGIWEQMYSIGINEASVTPAEGMVRIANQEFASRPSKDAAPWMLGRLVFDNLSQPLVAGIRSGVSDSRQLVFDAEGTIVDLVLNAKPESPTISLVGQVVDKAKSTIPRSVSIILWTESEELLAATSANEFGEFQMEFAAQDRLRLSIEIAGSKPIRIPPVNLNPNVARPSVTAIGVGRYEN